MERKRYIEAIGKTIERILGRECLIVFFGSVLREDFGRTSDIDVAVFCSEPLTYREYLKVLLELETLPFLRDIDLVDLWRVNSADFLSKIVEEGYFWKSSEGLITLLKGRLKGLRRSEIKTL